MDPKPDPDLFHRRLSTAVIAFHETVARRRGLGIAEHKCLGTLWEQGTATAGELARATGFTTGAITGIVDRLEKDRYVRREPNPKDRRSVLIRPLHVKKLRREVLPLFLPLTKSMTRLRKDFSAKELAAIDEYLARTTEILKKEAQKLKARR